MLPPDELTERARTACLAHACRVFPGELSVAAGEPKVAWDPTRLRHVSDQRLEVFREISRIEVLFDEQGSVVGFVDEGRWAGCAALPLDDDEALGLVRETGLLREPAAVVSRAEWQRGSLLLGIESGGCALRAIINPAQRSVIGLLPEDAL